MVRQGYAVQVCFHTETHLRWSVRGFVHNHINFPSFESFSCREAHQRLEATVWTHLLFFAWGVELCSHPRVTGPNGNETVCDLFIFMRTSILCTIMWPIRDMNLDHE